MMNVIAPNPRLSVLVLTRNRLNVLRNCVQSILSQRCQDFEIIILDDASDESDTAHAIAEEFADPRIRSYQAESSLGVAGGRNFLMEKARGEFLVVIDDDAVFVGKDALDEVCRAFDREPEAGVVAFKIVNVINGKRTPLSPLGRSAVTLDPEAVSKRAFVSFFKGGGHAIRKTIIDAHGKYRQDMVWGGEEADLAFRVIRARGRIVYEPSIEVDHFPMPSVIDRARDCVSSELYYQVRNHAYLVYRYIPWGYAFPYLGIWMFRYGIRSVREKSLFDFIRGVLATPRFLRGVQREVLDRRALGYLARYGGPLWKYLLVFEWGRDAEAGNNIASTYKSESAKSHELRSRAAA